MTLDLPLIWAGVLAVAVLMYVLLDGFDLGVGILFPFARSDEERDAMMNSIAPVWDGNETWLVLGGGGLFVVFPEAYAILLPALYLPIMAMLAGLILRGVAFEFRLRGRRTGKRLWTWAFAGGSIMAAAAQGLVLGGFIQGVAVRDAQFAGGALDWATPYSLLAACGLVAGYALLGAGWLVLKTEGGLHEAARRWTIRAAPIVALLLGAVSVATLIVHPLLAARWGLRLGAIDLGRLALLSPIPLLGLAGLIVAFLGGRSQKSHAFGPLAGGFLAFLSGYLGLAVSFLPFVVPYSVTYTEVASTPAALGLMLIGTLVLLPVILGYSAWVYWIFRGKVGADAGYH
ncbi:MAG TPA: cytochrome d ubiquinol oxidase subunit II [Caulobacteraceae bacterium]|nr:cytochrome d ubiquinol oxidase subunit II [Caulobacteraceae bacterium]